MAGISSGAEVSFYTAYGLTIRSHLPLPELSSTKATAEADVIVRYGEVDRQPTKEACSDAHAWATPSEVCFFWEEAGAFLVRNGREIIVDPAPGVAEKVVRLFFLGPVLAALLHQRGLLVLHASAAVMGGGAVAFLAGSGRGKSTVAAALHNRGYGILVDDVLALDVDQTPPLVLPGFAQLKLWPETIEALGEPLEILPRLHPDFEKRARRVDRDFPQDPLALQRIYVLAEGPKQLIEIIPPREAMVELVRYSYRIRLLQPIGVKSHFRRCAVLANSIPVRRLTAQRSLGKLSSLVELVEREISNGR